MIGTANIGRISFAAAGFAVLGILLIFSSNFQPVGWLASRHICRDENEGAQTCECGQQNCAEVTISSLSKPFEKLEDTAYSPSFFNPSGGAKTKEEFRLALLKKKINYDKIWMHPIEVDVILRYLSGAETYLEWGTGGSTVNFPRFVSRRAVAIEHDEPWCQKLAETLKSDPQLSLVDYRCVPRNRSVADPPGTSDGSYLSFRDYVDEITKTGDTYFDFVLIDGRARVDASIRALSYIQDKSVVALHDSSRVINVAENRLGQYQDVLKYYNAVDMTWGKGRQGVIILKRKQEYAYLQGKHSAAHQILLDKYGLNKAL